MPVYEFLCRRCNRIYSFHSFRVTTERVPSLPPVRGVRPHPGAVALRGGEPAR